MSRPTTLAPDDDREIAAQRARVAEWAARRQVAFEADERDQPSSCCSICCADDAEAGASHSVAGEIWGCQCVDPVNMLVCASCRSQIPRCPFGRKGDAAATTPRLDPSPAVIGSYASVIQSFSATRV